MNMQQNCIIKITLLHAQILKKFGAVNIPVWYEAGKYAQDSSPIPFSEDPFLPLL